MAYTKRYLAVGCESVILKITLNNPRYVFRVSISTLDDSVLKVFQ